jgi:predicted negative regulator of RcsB-dependent stress response
MLETDKHKDTNMKRSASSTQSGSALIIGVVVIAVAAVAGLAAWKIHQRNQTPAKQKATHNQSAADMTSQTAQPLTSGIDDQSLAKDITNLNDSANEGTQNLQSASAATDDQNHVVDVPTN